MAANSIKPGEKILFGVFIVIGVFAVISFIMLEIIRARSDKPMYPTYTSYSFTDEGLRGSALYRTQGCTACHRAVQAGTNMGLILDGIGSKHNLEYISNFLKNPEQTYQAKTVDHGLTPKAAAYVAKLPEEDLHLLAVFLSELRATQGSADARLPMPERSGFVDEMVKVWAPDNWKTEHQDVREEAKLGRKEEQSGTGDK